MHLLFESSPTNIEHMTETVHINIALDRLIDNPDALRDKIFEAAYKFYNHNCEEGINWECDSHRLEFEEFVEYYKVDRACQINELIEAELNWINGFTSYDGIDTMVAEINKQDNAHLTSLIINRHYFNDYV